MSVPAPASQAVAPAPAGRLADDPEADARRDTLAGRLFEATLGAFDLLAVQLGLELGLYRALRSSGPASAPELAARADIAPRYAREWLEHQAVAGLLEIVEPSDDADARRYALPAGHAEVLLDPESPSTMAPMPLVLLAATRAWPALLAAYRSGGGVDWNEYPLISEAQEAANRPVFRHLLAQEWLPAIPDVHARLLAGGARVADIASGGGWSSIAMGRAYPGIEVHGLDLDAEAVERARAKAREAGLEDRVRFHVVDASDHALDGTFDLVTIFEAVHDMAQPVAVLDAARRLLAPGGTVLVMDEKVAESFAAPGDEIERLMYGYSLFFCLANGLADQPSVGTGTVMRPSTLEAYATAAGFRGFRVLPIEHDVFRFYRLDP
ncbi:MAG TPA: methyltransferase domain-containing protein [Candidatus Limnocylindrales bacterium]|nr:methyltransferase domain-containing protein [Candidatus Limnocylindrales bacterium]